MGLKKYEIITVGSDKRVRALRSWAVGDRYVNIGDVGGVVYDEKTLSQDGACWLFRGNFNFPGARIGGDSIVDVGEAAPDVTGSGNLDILGTSAVVGAPVRFSSDKTAADAVVLTADDFEQGTFANYANGQAPGNSNSANFIRTRSPIFMGGVSATLKLDVPGYRVLALTLDRDGFVITGTSETVSGVGVTMTVPAGQYFVLRVTKDPMAAIVPAGAAAAKITFTGTYEAKLSIIDSRVEINPATSTGTTIIRPGGTYTFASGTKYPEAIIRNSKVSMSVPAVASRSYRIMGQIIESNATLDATAGNVSVAGQYSNIKNLMASGTITSNLGVTSYNVIQATNCNDFAVSPTIFPGLEAAITANQPFIFQGCNVPNGRFYHHAQIANTYRDINFDLATADLGKAIASGQILASAEVEGMYRLYSTTGSVFGALVEAHDSVKSLNMTGGAATYGTTIYKDAFLKGLFDIQGTNVFGHKVRSHPLAQVLNVQPRVVQGSLTTVVGQAPSYVYDINRVCILTPFRLNTAKGLSVYVPPGLMARFICVDARGLHTTATGWLTGTSTIPAANVNEVAAYMVIQKDGGTTPEDLAGATVTVYNGCKIVNTKATAATIAGNVRVEDNATVIDTSVTGTGYFGGNSIIQAPSALVGQLPIEGAAYMSDNAVFAPTEVSAKAGITLLEMKGNAVFAGGLNSVAAGYNITMAEEARCLGTVTTLGGFAMRDNSFIAAGRSVVSGCRGLLTMKDDARIENGNITAIGHITLCGSYNQTAPKTWTGKRVIDSQDAPTYDGNVKTKYDF